MSDNIIGFDQIDVVVSNKEFLVWYNDVHKADTPYDIMDFQLPINGESIAEVIEKFIKDVFSLTGYDVNVKLKERDNVEFPQRFRFLARCMVEFSDSKEFNRYKIAEPRNYAKLCKHYDNIVYHVNYGSD